MTSPFTTIPLLVPKPGEDSYDAVIRTCEAHVHRDGWHGDNDAPLTLFWLHRPVFGIAVSRPPMPDSVSHAHPLDVLPALAGSFVEALTAPDPHRASAPPRDLHGFVLCFEAWYAIDDGQPGTPRQRADRGEIREVLLGTFTGEWRHLARRRDQADVFIEQRLPDGRVAEMFDRFVTSIGLARAAMR